MSEWQVAEGRRERRRWHMVSWHGTYWVWEKEQGHWLITFGDLILAGAFNLFAGIAFAEWHDDFHSGRFYEDWGKGCGTGRAKEVRGE